MRSLKLLVIVMGVLLVGGSVALVAAVVGRVARPSSAPSGADAGAPAHASLPAGARVVSTELSGDRLLVRVALAGGGEELVLYNARTGSQVAVIDLPAGR
jgi:hypothetical protein